MVFTVVIALVMIVMQTVFNVLKNFYLNLSYTITF